MGMCSADTLMMSYLVALVHDDSEWVIEVPISQDFSDSLEIDSLPDF